MSPTYTTLMAIKTAIDNTTSFKSTKIGIERGIGSKDSPFARVMPIHTDADGKQAILHFSIAIGIDIKDLAEAYESFLDLEKEVREAVEANWLRTDFDEDQVTNLKVGVLHFSKVLDRC